jgi:hypothetical protein
MTIAELLAALLLLPIFLACLWRARLLALAIVPPLLFSAAQWLDLVDLSSASHPLRWIVPVACAGLAGFAGWCHGRRGRGTRRAIRWLDNLPPEWHGVLAEIRKRRAARGPGPGPTGALRYHTNIRALVASILVLGSCAPDLLALHPFFWAQFAEWPLVPLQIAVEVTILAVLLAPERWFTWATRQTL